MKITNNLILMKKNGSFLIEKTEKQKEKLNENVIFALKLELAQYGYILNQELINAFRGLSLKDLKSHKQELLAIIKEIIGDKVSRKPLFKNFPNDLPTVEDFFTNRAIGFLENILGYKPEQYTLLECGDIIDHNLFNINDFGACPICGTQIHENNLTPNKERPPLNEVTLFKTIKLANKKDLYKTFEDILSMPVSISAGDTEILFYLIENIEENILENHIPEKFKSREIRIFFLQFLRDLKDKNYLFNKVIEKQEFSVKDILRLAAAFSNCTANEINLVESPYFGSIPNKDRKLLLSLLEKAKNLEEDMALNKEIWKRLGEKLHPGSYKQFPKVQEAFRKLRNSKNELKSFNSKIEALIDFNDPNKLIKLLAARPGELFRRIDYLLRNEKTDIYLLTKTIEEKVSKIETIKLIDLIFHLKNRALDQDIRFFLPKGSVSKMKVLEGDKAIKNFNKIDIKKISAIIKTIEKDLIRRFKEQNLLTGNVYIDPALKDCLLASSFRNISDSLKTLPRGSRLKNPENKSHIRLFTYWKGEGIDLDLSVNYLSEDFKSVGFVTWAYPLNEKLGTLHSGDIRSAPYGASEFVDIDKEKARKAGARYLIMSVNSFTNEDFTKFETFCGVMNRDSIFSGEVFEPKTVLNKIDLKGSSTYICPLVYDLETDEIIVLDMSMKTEFFASAHNKTSNLSLFTQAILNFNKLKPNLYYVFNLHVKACKAKLVDNIELAPEENIFSMDKGLTPFEISKILVNWLK